MTKRFSNIATTVPGQFSETKKFLLAVFLGMSWAFTPIHASIVLANPAANAVVEKDASSSVDVANNAFEYRDFKKVIEILDPWVHPPRISETKLMAKARRLLGISYHLTGDVKQAAEEFAQLLLLEPDTKLDPFVVPPAVIETFDSVRKKMIPPTPSPQESGGREKPERVVQVVPHPSVSFLPFGYAQLTVVENQQLWGWTWLAAQVIGLAVNIGSYWAADSLREANGVPASKEMTFESYVLGMYAGAGLFTAAYLASSIQAYQALSHEIVSNPPALNPETKASAANIQFRFPVWTVAW